MMRPQLNYSTNMRLPLIIKPWRCPNLPPPLRARIADDWRTIPNQPNVINGSCTLYGTRWFVIECSHECHRCFNAHALGMNWVIRALLIGFLCALVYLALGGRLWH
jgi:hypothetical protein